MLIRVAHWMLDAVIQFVGRVYLFLVYYMKYGYGRFSLEAESSL